MKNLNNWTLGAVAVFVLAGGYWGYAQYVVPQAEAQTGLIPYKNTQVMANGEEIYSTNCAACHGDNLEGEENWKQPKPTARMPAPPHDETGHTWHHSDQLLFNLTKYGIARLSNNPDYQTDMPVYEGVLSDDQIIAVLAYIKSTWPEEIQQRHDQMNAGGS